MRVVGTVVHVHVLDDAASKTVLGEHAFEYMNVEGVHTGLDVLVERFLHQSLGGSDALTAGVSGVAEVGVIGHFLAGEDNLVGVDDDDIVAALYEGRIGGFVFSAQDLGDFRAKTAEMLTCSVDEYPFFLYALGVGGNGFVT